MSSKRTDTSAESASSEIRPPKEIFEALMRDGTKHLVDPAGGMELINCVLNTTLQAGGAFDMSKAKNPAVFYDLTVYKLPDGKYVTQQWQGEPGDRKVASTEVVPAQAASKLLKAGLPVPTGLPLPDLALVRTNEASDGDYKYEFKDLELIPAGFAYKNEPYDLAGKPRAMLNALLKSRYTNAAQCQNPARFWPWMTRPSSTPSR